MTQDQPVIRIGELLVQAGVITTYDLSEAEKLSSHMKVQFGRLLIMAGCLTEEALECALEAQGLIKEGMLTPTIACEALAFAVQENIPLRQALEVLDCLPQFGTSTLRLAELIHDANIIDEERLHDAFDTSMETNRPLPEVLVEMECISPGLLSIMLRMQEQIRNDTLDHEDSINELRGTFKIWKRADKAMANDPMSKSAIIGAASLTPEKPTRFTSSFDTVNRLPAISDEMLASLNKESRVPNPANANAQSAASGNTSAASSAQPPAPSAAPTAGALAPQHLQNAPSAFSNQNAPSLTNAAGSVNGPKAPNYPNTPPSNFPGSPSQHPSQSVPAAYNAPPANTRPPSPNASPRGGSDDLNVDWILNAPAGQPMPEEVILYSQGYFPPDPQKSSSEETFNDGFSDEDEQRINDLLDVFASDSPATAPNGPPETGQMGASKSGDSSRDTNFAQASYSASLAAAAADGWGVPDLAAAGANLSGAEMFARAQAELASGGWAYSQGTAGQTGHKFPSIGAPTDSSRGTAASDVASSPSAYSAAKTQPPVAPAPAPAPGPLGQPTFVTPVAPAAPSAPAQSAPPLPSRPAAPLAPSTSSTPAPPAKPSTPTITETPALSPPLTPSTMTAPKLSPTALTPSTTSAPVTPSSSPSPWAPPPSAAPSSTSAAAISTTPSTASALSARETPRDSATDSTKESLFSPRMADSISDALQANPSAETEGADHKSAISEPEPESAAYDESAANKSDVVEAKNVPSADDARVDSEAEQHPVDEDSAKATEPSAKSESDSSHPDVSETLRSTEKDADAKLDQESKTKDKNAPESSTISVPAGPRGRFGTKTGLAAKRKASESSEEDAERNDVVFLLKSANFFSADELEDAIINSLRDQNKAIEILGILGIIDKSNLDAAVRLQKLVKSGSVDVNKAIESLTDLKSGKLRASELTEQLGIKKSKRRK